MSRVRYKVVDYLDYPKVLDASSTNIPGSGSSPLQVVASLADHCHHIYVRDGIGTEFIGVYTGGSGSEVLQQIIGGHGPSEVNLGIRAGTRISLRSMSTSAITSGSIAILFMGLDPS